MEQKKRKTEVKSIAINGYLLDRANTVLHQLDREII
jgi:hypothetical protein